MAIETLGAALPPVGQDAVIDLVRENERMKAALKSVITYASRASFGSWRGDVVQLARNGLYT